MLLWVGHDKVVDVGSQHSGKATTTELKGDGKGSCKFLCGIEGAPSHFLLWIAKCLQCQS